MNEFQVPADLGRIPGKIYCDEGFSNFTVDQWRIFISIYTTVVLWEYLEEVDRKILTYFVRICHLFVNRILETKSLDEIHKKIVDVVTLIEKKYGRNVITPNLHLSLHLSACSHDFGLLYAFWYFSFERMNGILAKFASEDDNIDIYPGQIQFFFVHEISTNRINMENHYLAYVRWYKKIKNRFYFGINQEQMCNVELWDTEFYPKSRDCIIPVHHILGRFVPVKYKISDRKNAKEYLAVDFFWQSAEISDTDLLEMIHTRWETKHLIHRTIVKGNRKIELRRLRKNTDMQKKKKLRNRAAEYLFQGGDEKLALYPRKEVKKILNETEYHSEE
ncbi:hypothetical protein Glove_33g60 [Diversispora epigaea]|uniref:Transposase domain-containing protein n=1 Tax=Diversispora epigaea TaxID=1348612 RepID=A0A397JGX8_9GLOM|nr:hypothetical protein Glove_33g60 [Diversispora epigaea]